MLSQNTYYWGTLRRIVVAFGSLFSDIHIMRADGKAIKVPLTYGPKEKWIYRTKQDPMPGVDDQVEMILPRLSYEVVSMQYDTLRKLTSTGRTMKTLMSDAGTLKAQFNPVPYNIAFNVYVMTKTIQDGLMIVEQILPFFTPEYTVTITDMPDMGFTKDIPIVLNGIQSEDTWDGDFKERRTITWILSFVAKAYLYPPVIPTKVILKADTNFDIDDLVGTPALPSIVTTPLPMGANADTITGAQDTLTDLTVKVLAAPGAATLGSGQHQVFAVQVINTSDVVFTYSGVSPTDTATLVGNTFTYTAGTRTQQETVVVEFTAHADTSKHAVVVLTLNP